MAYTVSVIRAVDYNPLIPDILQYQLLEEDQLTDIPKKNERITTETVEYEIYDKDVDNRGSAQDIFYRSVIIGSRLYVEGDLYLSYRDEKFIRRLVPTFVLKEHDYEKMLNNPK